MKNLIVFACVVVLIASCKKKKDDDNTTTPTTSSSYVTYDGKKMPLTQFYVSIDTVWGRFYNDHLYEYSLLYASPGLNIFHDNTEITGVTGKGDVLLAYFYSDVEPPKDGNYNFDFTSEEAMTLVDVELMIGYDATLDSADNDIYYEEDATGFMKFTKKDAANHIYKTEFSMPKLEAVIEGKHTAFRRF
ncbi:MAG: hypothetical protein JNM67_09965 [Bacteroidetes bacterium]|nr:hypothetical protein [Bacteroidota bacterium]